MVHNLDAGDTEDLPIKFLIALEHNMMVICKYDERIYKYSVK